MRDITEEKPEEKMYGFFEQTWLCGVGMTCISFSLSLIVRTDKASWGPLRPWVFQIPRDLSQTHKQFFLSSCKDESGCFYEEWRRVYCKIFLFAWSCDSDQISLLVGTCKEAWAESREVRRIWGHGSDAALTRNTKAEPSAHRWSFLSFQGLQLSNLCIREKGEHGWKSYLMLQLALVTPACLLIRKGF